MASNTTLKYYPLTRIKPNLYTRGGDLELPDGSSYTGRYYVTYEDKAYTGINPVLGTNILLASARSNQSPNTGYTQGKSNGIQTKTTRSSLELTDIQSYNPIVVESDYVRGYFIRYFAKRLTGPGYITEISEETYSNITNGKLPSSILGYQITEMTWQLTGPLNNTRVSPYQVVGGVYDTNKKTTEAKAVGFTGLIAFIGGDYTKFARITP